MLVKFIGYVIGMFVVSAISFGFWIFQYHQPLQEEKRRIDRKYTELRNKQKRGRKLKQEIKALQKQIRSTKAEIVTLLKEKTKNRDVGKFLNDVEADSKNAGVTLRSIRIHPKTQRQRFIEIPMEYSVEGSYFEIYDFFQRVENRQMLNLTNSQINISGGGTDRGVKVKNLSKKIDKSKKLLDLDGKSVNLPKVNNETRFPRLRVNFDGRIIIIDKSHIQRFEDG